MKWIKRQKENHKLVPFMIHPLQIPLEPTLARSVRGLVKQTRKKDGEQRKYNTVSLTCPCAHGEPASCRIAIGKGDVRKEKEKWLH
jgi:hypothetical protein